MSGIFGGGGSSSSSTTTQSATDPEAARRMAAVAERQMAMAEEQWGLGKEIYMPYEKAMVESNKVLIDKNQALMEKRLTEGAYDIEQDRERRDLIRSQMTEELRASAGIPSKFYEETLSSGDPRERMGMASADVEKAFASSEGARRREIGRMGINPNSGAFSSQRGADYRNKVLAMSSARTGARRAASDDLYSRLSSAMTARAGAQVGSIDSAAYQQGEQTLGGYQMTNPLDRSSQIYSNVINANAAGMKPLTQSESDSRSFNFSISAERYKEDIISLEIDENIVDQLKPVSFKYKGDDTLHHGLIAEELREVIPEAVVVNDKGFTEGIMYNEIVPTLILVIQSLKTKVQELEDRVNANI